MCYNLMSAGLFLNTIFIYCCLGGVVDSSVQLKKRRAIALFELNVQMTTVKVK